MRDGGVYTLIAFDYGLKRIGIAAGDSLTRTANPRSTASVGVSGPDWQGIEREIAALRPALLIVGAPYNVDGSPGTLTRAASAFAAELESRFGLPVKRVDERWSSLEATAALRARRQSGARSRRVQRGEIDSAAAAVILERWFGGEEERT